MSNLIFKTFKRKGLSEMIPFKEFVGQDMSKVSVSDADKQLSNEDFELGYIARNPKNHEDLWYVAKKYFDDNLEAANNVQRVHESFLTFGEAIVALKCGKSVQRSGWNGKNMCIYLKKGSDSTSFINEDGTVEFPDMIRGDLFDVSGKNTIRRIPCLCMKTATGSIVEGWLASQTDILAEDWQIVK